MVDNELITKVRIRNVKSILSNVFTSNTPELTNGNGTTANGSAVDLGGTVSSDVNLVWGTDNKNWYFGQGQSSDNYTPYIEIIKAPTAGSLSSINMRANGITSGGAYRGFVTLQGFTSAAIAEIGIVLAGVTTKFGFDPGGAYLNLGSDATGDTYYRNSSGYLTRLPAGTNGHVLTLAAGIPSWAAASGGISGLTTGRIPFAASATTLTDDATLAWDNTDKKLTFGTHFAKSHSTGLYIGKNLGTVGMASGVYNVVIGEDLGLAFTSATRNVLIGHDAGRAITSAQYNIAIGEAALRLSTTAGENVGIGYRALYQATGEDNIGIGFGAAQNLVGGRNNILIGYYAGAAGAAGVVGRTDYTSGDDSIFIGSYLTTDDTSEDAQINIGNVIFSRGNSGANPIPYPQVGRVGIYITSPTARLHLPATTSTANTASLKIPSGTLLATPEAGAIEADATAIYWTNNAGTRIDLSGAGGGGTVTSVAMSVPSFLAVSGSPITTSGTLAVTWNGGTGVDTYLGTPSWTNLLSATTGTVPFWSLASGGTATAANTFTASLRNGLTFTGTWTGTTDSDTHRTYTGTITGSGTAAHSFYGDQFRTTLTAGANNQSLYGVNIQPTLASGGFTGVGYYSLNVQGSTVSGSQSIYSKAGGTNSGSYFALSCVDNASTSIFSVRSDAVLANAGTSIGFFNISFATASSAGNQYVITHNKTPDDGGYAHNIRSSATISSTSGARGRVQVIGGTFSPSSGTATETTFRVSQTLNQTGTASGVIKSLLIDPTVTSATGDIYGIDYNPSVTTISGKHLAFRNTSGSILHGATTKGANTGELVMILNNASTNATAAQADGIVIHGRDSSDGSANSTLALYLEQAPEATATFTQSHRLKIWINGTEYYLPLDNV